MIKGPRVRSIVPLPKKSQTDRFLLRCQITGTRKLPVARKASPKPIPSAQRMAMSGNARGACAAANSNPLMPTATNGGVHRRISDKSAPRKMSSSKITKADLIATPATASAIHCAEMRSAATKRPQPPAAAISGTVTTEARPAPAPTLIAPGEGIVANHLRMICSSRALSASGRGLAGAACRSS